MYNALTRVAYKDGSDYYITLNDDAILITRNWTTMMINTLYKNQFLSNFGTTGFICINNMGLLQFNLYQTFT